MFAKLRKEFGLFRRRMAQNDEPRPGTGLLSPGSDSQDATITDDISQLAAAGKSIWRAHFERAFEFSDWVLASLADGPVDVCLVHDSYALAAGRQLKQKWRCGLAYDCVEYPDYACRSGQSFKAYEDSPDGRYLCLSHDMSVVSQADVLMVGSAGVTTWFAENTEHAPVLIRNCLDFQDLSADARIRDDCGLDSQDKLLVYPNTVHRTSKVENLLGALSLLPSTVHLAISGRLERGLETSFFERIEELELTDRVHALRTVDPAELIQYRSGADAAVIMLNPDNQNHFQSCPNRVFESIASRLPLVTSDVPHIKRIVEQFGCGRVFSSASAKCVADTIAEVLDAASSYKVAAEAAARELCWKNERSRYIEALRPVLPDSAGTKIVYLADKSIVTSQRTYRHTRTLTELGYDVVVMARAGPPVAALRVDTIDYRQMNDVSAAVEASPE